MIFRRVAVLSYVYGMTLVLSGQALAPVQLESRVGVSGTQESVLTNTTSKVVTAVALTGPRSGPSGRVQLWKPYDAATEPLAVRAVLPGQSLVVPVKGPDASGELFVSGIVFADGTTWGDPASVARLLKRREYMQKYLLAAIADLGSSAISTTPLSDAALRSQFTQRFKSAMAQELAASANIDEAACVKSVRAVTILNLQHVTQRGNGSAITTQEVISHELMALSSRLSKLKAGGM